MSYLISNITGRKYPHLQKNIHMYQHKHLFFLKIAINRYWRDPIIMWSLTQGTGLQRAPPQWSCWPDPRPLPWVAWWPDGASSPAGTSPVWARCTSWAGWWCVGRCVCNRAWLHPWHPPWSWPGSWGGTRHFTNERDFSISPFKWREHGHQTHVVDCLLKWSVASSGCHHETADGSMG